jgi:hypothetical protein
MFHKSNFGSFGDQIPSDRDGYVPEEGDLLDEFNFDGEMDEDEWDEFVAAAVEATQGAESAVTAWRAS